VTGIALFDRVAHAAEADATRLLAEARVRADEIRSAAAASRAARRRAATDALRAELASTRERACTEANAQTGRAILESRDRLLERALAAAEAAIVNLPESPELVRCIERLLGNALSYVEVGHRTVHCSRASQSLVVEVLRSLGCADVPVAVDDSLSTGAIVKSDDARVSIDATLVGQLRSRRQALSIAALTTATSGSGAT
jgi:vacuolar-type H+-ATPase subunit E/Vma4